MWLQFDDTRVCAWQALTRTELVHVMEVRNLWDVPAITAGTSLLKVIKGRGFRNLKSVVLLEAVENRCHIHLSIEDIAAEAASAPSAAPSAAQPSSFKGPLRSALLVFKMTFSDPDTASNVRLGTPPSTLISQLPELSTFESSCRG